MISFISANWPIILAFLVGDAKLLQSIFAGNSTVATILAAIVSFLQGLGGGTPPAAPAAK